MNELTCCDSPESGKVTTDLGHADSFDFLLVRCRNCGSYWLNVFCETTSITGYEPVSEEDAQAMLAFSSGRELKAFMKAWSYKHL
jgi:hypothetical protein